MKSTCVHFQGFMSRIKRVLHPGLGKGEATSVNQLEWFKSKSYLLYECNKEERLKMSVGTSSLEK